MRERTTSGDTREAGRGLSEMYWALCLSGGWALARPSPIDRPVLINHLHG